jgi:hypothetical protein
MGLASKQQGTAMSTGLNFSGPERDYVSIRVSEYRHVPRLGPPCRNRSVLSYSARAQQREEPRRRLHRATRALPFGECDVAP